MKPRFEALLWWVIVQVCLCGMEWINQHNNVVDHIQTCYPAQKADRFMGFIVPVYVLLPDNPEVAKYCNQKPEIK